MVYINNLKRTFRYVDGTNFTMMEMISIYEGFKNKTEYKNFQEWVNIGLSNGFIVETTNNQDPANQIDMRKLSIGGFL